MVTKIHVIIDTLGITKEKKIFFSTHILTSAKHSILMNLALG